MKFCKHIHMFKVNTTNKNFKGKGPILLELFPFVILNGFLYRLFCVYLKESSMEFHQILQTHSYVHGKYY